MDMYPKAGIYIDAGNRMSMILSKGFVKSSTISMTLSEAETKSPEVSIIAIIIKSRNTWNIWTTSIATLRENFKGATVSNIGQSK